MILPRLILSLSVLQIVQSMSLTMQPMYIANPGQNVTFECNKIPTEEKQENYTILWKKNTQPIAEGNVIQRYKGKLQSIMENGNYQLQIKNVDAGDRGPFSCSFMNTKLSASTYLVVNGYIPQPLCSMKTIMLPITPNKTNDVTITCSSEYSLPILKVELIDNYTGDVLAKTQQPEHIGVFTLQHKIPIEDVKDDRFICRSSNTNEDVKECPIRFQYSIQPSMTTANMETVSQSEGKKNTMITEQYSADHTKDNDSGMSPTEDDDSDASPTEDDVNGVSPTEDDVNGVSPTEDDVNSVSPTEDDVNSVSPTEEDVNAVSPSIKNPEAQFISDVNIQTILAIVCPVLIIFSLVILLICVTCKKKKNAKELATRNNLELLNVHPIDRQNPNITASSLYSYEGEYMNGSRNSSHHNTTLSTFQVLEVVQRKPSVAGDAIYYCADCCQPEEASDGNHRQTDNFEAYACTENNPSYESQDYPQNSNNIKDIISDNNYDELHLDNNHHDTNGDETTHDLDYTSEENPCYKSLEYNVDKNTTGLAF